MAATLIAERDEQPLISVAWTILCGLIIFHSAVILLPLFAMGVYSMRAGEIWATTIDVRWHPYYASGALLPGAAIALLIWLYVTTPLSGLLTLNTMRSGSRWPVRVRVVRIAILLVYITALIATILYWTPLTAWIFD
jgi:hypothetical protein